MNNRLISRRYVASLLKPTLKFIEQPHLAPPRTDSRNRNQLFLDSIPTITEFASTNILNLKQMAEAAKLDNKGMHIWSFIGSYASAELLERFHHSLDDLKKLQEKSL